MKKLLKQTTYRIDIMLVPLPYKSIIKNHQNRPPASNTKGLSGGKPEPEMAIRIRCCSGAPETDDDKDTDGWETFLFQVDPETGIPKRWNSPNIPTT